MAMIGYIIIGHGWNHAATHIDDHMGDMEGYTAIIYQGTTEPEPGMRDSDGKLYDASVFAMLDEQNIGYYPPGREPSFEQRKGVRTGDIVRSYQNKGAAVVAVRLKLFSWYSEPVIVENQGRKVGIYSVRRGISAAGAAAKAQYAREQGADITVAIIDNPVSVVRAAASADVVICAFDADLPSGGRAYNNTLGVDSPYITTVGAVLVAPSNVVSAKVIESL